MNMAADRSRAIVANFVASMPADTRKRVRVESDDNGFKHARWPLPDGSTAFFSVTPTGASEFVILAVGAALQLTDDLFDVAPSRAAIAHVDEATRLLRWVCALCNAPSEPAPAPLRMWTTPKPINALPDEGYITDRARSALGLEKMYSTLIVS